VSTELLPTEKSLCALFTFVHRNHNLPTLHSSKYCATLFTMPRNRKL